MDDNFFQKFDGRKTSSGGFSNRVLVPFISGILGAILVVGVCFGVPSIKNKLVNNINNNDSSYNSQLEK